VLGRETPKVELDEFRETFKMAILSQASHGPDWKVQRLEGLEGILSNTSLASNT